MVSALATLEQCLADVVADFGFGLGGFLGGHARRISDRAENNSPAELPVRVGCFAGGK